MREEGRMGGTGSERGVREAVKGGREGWTLGEEYIMREGGREEGRRVEGRKGDEGDGEGTRDVARETEAKWKWTNHGGSLAA